MTDQTIFCTSCGAANHPDARFCYQCGAAILKAGTGAPAAPQDRTSQPVPPSGNGTPAAPSQVSSQPRKKKERLFSAVEIVAGLAAAFVLYLALTIVSILVFNRAGIRIDNLMDKIGSAVQQRALRQALERFDSYQSYTVELEYNVLYTEWDSMSFDLHYRTMVNLAEGTSIGQNLDPEADGKITSLCTPEGSYSADETGLLKPAQYECELYRPQIPYLRLDLASLQASQYEYLGEETLPDGPARKYELLLTEDQWANPESGYTLSNPVFYLYVSEENGNLVLIEYSIENVASDYGTNFSEEGAVRFSDWDTTSFAIPAHVSRDDTTLDTYTGGSANTLHFDYPRIYQLNGNLADGYMDLSTPDGGWMYFFYAEQEASILGDFQYALYLDPELSFQDTCDAFAVYVTDWIGSIYSQNDLLGQTLLEGDTLNFCQAILDTEDGPIAYYFFFEPEEVASSHSRFEPLIYILQVTPAEGEDPATIFLGVIQSIGLE